MCSNQARMTGWLSTTLLLDSLTAHMRRPLSTLIVLAAALLLNGCVTGAVWQHKAFHAPAPEPRLQLSVAPQAGDILVEYDSLNERTDKVRRHAYLLAANEERVARSQKPHFVDSRDFSGLQPVPVFSEQSVPAIPPSALYATTNRHGFTLHFPRAEPATHSLPVFFDGVTRTRQVLLTPPALVVDATIVGSIIGGI